MQLNTTRFGTIEVNESEFINFPWGIPGFEEFKSYILLQYKNGPFQWLQSTDEPSVAFVVCPPGFIEVEYKVPVSKTTMIKLEKTEDLVILLIVSFDQDNPDKKKAMRVHVRSPLLFNVAARIGYQWTMEPDELKRQVVTPAIRSPEKG